MYVVNINWIRNSFDTHICTIASIFDGTPLKAFTVNEMIILNVLLP
jgi:hypothetical protein